MPLYEGIGGMITEKQPVVIDLGYALTKVGFAGEAAPRFIIPTEVKNDETKLSRKVYHYKTPEDLYDLLVTFVHSLYFKCLLVSAKERRVVIVESLLCPTLVRETLAKVLFQHFEVTSVLYVPSHLVALCSLGVNTALTLDMGYQEAILVPVYEGIPILHAWQAQPLGAQAVEFSIKSMLLKHYGEAEEEVKDNIKDLPDTIIEDIKVRTCFVTTLERVKKIETDGSVQHPPDVEYREGNIRSFTVPGNVRELAHEVLFEQDNEQVSVATMILDSILKCPVDMRKPLAENILIIGGASMIPGFKARLLSELKLLATAPKYSAKFFLKTFKFHKPPAKENYAAWLGAAIAGGTEILMTRSLTKETYLKTNHVPDWCNMMYNRQEDSRITA